MHVLTDSEYLSIIENADHGALATDSEELEALEPNEYDFLSLAALSTSETHFKVSKTFLPRGF